MYLTFDHEVGFSYIKPNNAITEISPYTEWYSGTVSLPPSWCRTSDTSAQWLGYFRMSPKIDLTSFTLGFYLRVTGTEIVGVYDDDHDLVWGHLRFSLTAVNLDLELHIHKSSASFSYGTVISYTFQNVFKANQWQFVALTYDGASRQVKIYDETATVKLFGTNIQIDQVFTYSVWIGDSYRYGIVKRFTRSSAIACFSLHNKVLSQMDIALLPCACQFKDRQQ